MTPGLDRVALGDDRKDRRAECRRNVGREPPLNQ
jgi:hypothetical protein